MNADRLGSTTHLTDATEATTDTREYDAYGMTVSSTGSTATPFGYVGKAGYQQDADSGLMLLGHRYYDASTGRFITRDPLQDGRNWYCYVDNKALSAGDSTGCKWTGLGATVGCAVGFAVGGPLGAIVGLGLGLGAGIPADQMEDPEHPLACAPEAALALAGGFAGSVEIEFPTLESETPGLMPWEGGPERLVPEEWGPGRPAKRGIGWRYNHPELEHSTIRIMKGKPDKGGPYVKISVHGEGYLDANGKGGVAGDSAEAHIPYDVWKGWKTWCEPW